MMFNNSELQFEGIYDDLIMDHYLNPRNRNPINEPDIEHHDWNPFCGDEVDINIEDSIYDIYYLDLDNLDYYSCRPAEIHVGHFWYNGDTGREISWTRAKPYTDFNKVESA